MRNLPLTFDYSTYGQKLGEDFAKFCGLLRIYELYYKKSHQKFMEVQWTLVIVNSVLSPILFTNERCLLFSIYRISANSFRGNYSFLNLALFTVTFDLYFINLNSCRGNYSREETIQGRKLFAEIRYAILK